MTITGQALVLTPAQVVADISTVRALTLAQAAVHITITTAPVRPAALHIIPPTTQALYITQVALVS